jgi:hypothetical protein
VSSDPAFLWVPERRGSYGDEAAELMAMAGRPLDGPQRVAVDAHLSYGPGGKPVALEAVVKEPRQNGKTGGVLEPVVLYDLFLGPPDRIVWTAHLFRTARDAFADIVGLIDGCADLSRRVRKVTYANGEESVELTTGARLEFLARSKGGGRGLGGKRLIMDEALFLSAEAMGALIPTLSARPDPQINYGSSAELASSDYLARLTRRGRAGGDRSLIYVEWRAPGGWSEPGCEAGLICTHEFGQPGCALDDETRWRAANPACPERIALEYIRQERAALPPREFGRERLGWEEQAAGAGVIGEAVWSARAGAEGRPERPAVAVAGSWPDAEVVSIGLAGRVGDRRVVQLVEHRPGLAWVVRRVRELARWEPCAVVVDPAGPAGQLVPDLEQAAAECGFELVSVTGREACHAAGAFLAAVSGAGADVAHYGQPDLDESVTSASKHHVGDVWRWDRNATSAPVEAVTLALYGHTVKADADQPFFAAFR